MKLTWEEFLKLVSIVRNLFDSISKYNKQKIDIKEKTRRIALAVNECRKLFKDSKFVEFTETFRIS